MAPDNATKKEKEKITQKAEIKFINSFNMIKSTVLKKQLKPLNKQYCFAL